MRIYTTIVQTKSIPWNNNNEVLNALKWASYCTEVTHWNHTFRFVLILNDIFRVIIMLVKRFISKNFCKIVNQYVNTFHLRIFQMILSKMLIIIFYMSVYFVVVVVID